MAMCGGAVGAGRGIGRVGVSEQRDFFARHTLRQEQSRPLLDALAKCLRTTKAQVLSKSPVGGVVDYALNNRDALCRYTTDPDLHIDNNHAEQAVCAIAIGRKNWLFFGSDRGGHAAAIHFSLIASARRQRVFLDTQTAPVR